jgi:hypothetical protein
LKGKGKRKGSGALTAAATIMREARRGWARALMKAFKAGAYRYKNQRFKLLFNGWYRK